MAKNVVSARGKILREDMLETIDNDYSNLSLLTAQYGKHCKLAMNDSEAFIAEILDREFSD
jgi:hypothetical protein